MKLQNRRIRDLKYVSCDLRLNVYPVLAHWSRTPGLQHRNLVLSSTQPLYFTTPSANFLLLVFY